VYTAILTLLAVSLYLLGFSLTLGEQPRRWISATGMVFVVIGSAWALSVAVTHPRSPPNEAAQRFADGTLALSTAWDRYDNSGYKKAERDFDRAIALRPSYAQAYAKRANATYIAASPQRATYMSVTTPAALQRAIDDQERAIRLGLSNARIQGSLGFDLFQLALQKQEPRLLAESIRQTGQAIAAAPALDYLRYNLGVALLADDRVEESRKAYQDAVEHTAYDDEDLVAGALTDLELVRRYLPKLAPQVQQMKGSIVGSVLTGHPGPHHSDATITGTKAHMFTAAVQVEQMQLKDVASDDVISLQWYYNDTQHHGWFVLPDVSGLVTTSSKQGEDLLTDGTDGYFNQRSHLRETTPPQCLAEGEYRVEVYVGGDLKDTAEADWKVPSMQPSVLQSLNTAMCHPSDWVGDERVPGVLQGFHSPDGSRGAYFFEFSLPRGITKRQLTTFPETSVNFAVSSFTTLFPHSPKPYGDSGSAYFMGLDGGTYRYFSYHGGYVLVTAGYDPREAIMIVGIAFGPKDDFPGGISYLVDDSFTRYQPLP